MRTETGERAPRALGGCRQQPARHQSPRASDLKTSASGRNRKPPNHRARLATRPAKSTRPWLGVKVAGTQGTRGATVGTLTPHPVFVQPPPSRLV